MSRYNEVSRITANVNTNKAMLHDICISCYVNEDISLWCAYA